MAAYRTQARVGKAVFCILTLEENHFRRYDKVINGNSAME